VSFWRRTNATFINMPVEKVHANSKHEFAQPGFAVSDFCSLANGLTLLATNQSSLVVIGAAGKVLLTVGGLSCSVERLVPLAGCAFVAIAGGTIDIYDDDAGDVICGAHWGWWSQRLHRRPSQPRLLTSPPPALTARRGSQHVVALPAP